MGGRPEQRLGPASMSSKSVSLCMLLIEVTKGARVDVCGYSEIESSLV